jgi:hypothetical protein
MLAELLGELLELVEDVLAEQLGELETNKLQVRTLFSNKLLIFSIGYLII